MCPVAWNACHSLPGLVTFSRNMAGNLHYSTWLDTFKSFVIDVVCFALPFDTLISRSMLVAQSCLTLCDPMDCSPPGSSVHGILQARTLEWVAIPLSRGISHTQRVNPALPHCRQVLYHWNHQGYLQNLLFHVRCEFGVWMTLRSMARSSCGSFYASFRESHQCFSKVWPGHPCRSPQGLVKRAAS